MKSNLFPVTDGKRKRLISFIYIKRMDAYGAYVIVHTLDGRQYIKCWNLGKAEKFTRHSGLFFRSHESCLINTVHINWLEQFRGMAACIMLDGTRVPLARRRKKAFKKLIAKMTAGK